MTTHPTASDQSREAARDEIIHRMLSELAGIDTHDANLRDQGEVYEIVEKAFAALSSSAPSEAADAKAALTDAEIDAMDTGALHVMAPRGRESVREFAHRLLATHSHSAPSSPPPAPSSKPMTLGEQVRDAQRTVDSWSAEKRASVQLEGQPLSWVPPAPTDAQIDKALRAIGNDAECIAKHWGLPMYDHSQLPAWRKTIRNLFASPPSAPQAPEAPTEGVKAEMLISQEPKYTIRNGRIVNRASGEPIPDDEPVFIFRARDKLAVGALLAYSMKGLTGNHYAAVRKRVKHFRAFASRHPERMKIPDTALAASPEPAQPCAPVAPQAGYEEIRKVMLDAIQAGLTPMGVLAALDAHCYASPGKALPSPEPAEPDKERGAAKYAWMRDRFIGADFAWNAEEDGSGGKSVLLIEIPEGTRVWGSLDETLDAAALKVDAAIPGGETT